MINNNYKQLEKLYLESFASGSGMVPVMNVSGMISYAAPTFAFPASRTQTFTLSATTAGISFGTGTTAATELDYNLEETITDGINVTIISTIHNFESETGSPYIQYTFTIINTSSEAISISEVGYKQDIASAPYVGSTSRSNKVCLIDRTVLNVPLTIEPDDAGILVYKLETPILTKIVNGVKIVPWEFGSDEDITAMISAAHAGTIDLQEDAGWRIGMKRPIDIAAFTGGGDTAHAAQTIDLVITSFDDYENCGCVMQVDFDEALAEGQRMNPTNTNAGGYGATEMYTTTLPALVQALPQYLQNMLITFTCKASAGSKIKEIVEITGNKLALRSFVEIRGVLGSTVEGEGSWNTYYSRLPDSKKRRGRSGSVNYYWTRSPYSSESKLFLAITDSGGGSSNADNRSGASLAYGIAPFACL